MYGIKIKISKGRMQHLGAVWLSGRDKQILPRFRVRNEVRRATYWKGEEEKLCRLCRKAEETLGLVIEDCKENSWER